MKIEGKKSAKYILLLIAVFCAFGGFSYGQITINITIQGSNTAVAPFHNSTISNEDKFKIEANVAVTGGGSVDKVVYYRNDVPYKTVEGSPYHLITDPIGQDTYTFRARAYDTLGNVADSNEIKMEVHTPVILKMGTNNGNTITLEGPGRDKDHTDDIRNAITFLGSAGGTILFPCIPPTDPTPDAIAIYNIKDTIDIPANITLQGEGALYGGICRIYFFNNARSPWECGARDTTLQNKTLFRVIGTANHVRFKDLWIYSRTHGSACWPYENGTLIEQDGTTAIEFNTEEGETAGNIRDIIIENVTIASFTTGIKAYSEVNTDHEISDVKIRGYRALTNGTQLSIDSEYAYDWDVQNLNLTGMDAGQGDVEIKRAGKPSTYAGMGGNLKFLQLNCNSTADPNENGYCVKVTRHGGLYFRQLHHEGVNTALIVEDISGDIIGPTSNPEPIVMESSVATGEFKDPSMTLYLIGNVVGAAPYAPPSHFDQGRMKFFDNGSQATLVDCGDVHIDGTPVPTGTPFPNQNPTYGWENLQMIQSHSERNRASFYTVSNNIPSPKSHIPCPADLTSDTDEISDINTIGGEYFDSGVLPTEIVYDNGVYLSPYSVRYNLAECQLAYSTSTPNMSICLKDFLAKGGTVFIDGSFTLTETVKIPNGSQMVGYPGYSTLNFNHSASSIQVPMLEIELEHANIRIANTVFQDLKLTTNTQSNMVGIAFVNKTSDVVGVSSDFHLRGLTIEGFSKGIYAGLRICDTNDAQKLDCEVGEPFGANPMIDGVLFRHLTFNNNLIGFDLNSSNASNWNLMDLKFNTNINNSQGWKQIYGGFQNFQRVTCDGTSSSQMMKDCLRLQMAGAAFITDLRKTSYVTNSLTIGEGFSAHPAPYDYPVFTSLVIRDSNLTSGQNTPSNVNILGKAFITSFNNKYTNFSVTPDIYSRGQYSRITYCNDSYPNDEAYPGLEDYHPNRWVGSLTPTRIKCSADPIPWEEPFKFTPLEGTKEDIPLVGNFSHSAHEDYVVYQPARQSGQNSYFHIKEAGGTVRSPIQWGLMGDIPVVGKFLGVSNSQIGIFRPSTGDWWMYNPNTNSMSAFWNWGLAGDIPFVGDFLPQLPGDEAAVFRPSDQKLYILNPYSGSPVILASGASQYSQVQVGDFSGSGYDQIALFHNGTWVFIDADNPGMSMSSITFGSAGDVPVAAKYFPTVAGNARDQIGVWDPQTQILDVRDPISVNPRTGSVRWGGNNNFDNPTTLNSDIFDKLLTVATVDGTRRKPVAYCPTKGIFPESDADGQWWIHDPIDPQ